MKRLRPIILVIAIMLFVWLGWSFSQSLFFQSPERLGIVFYGSQTTVYIFSKEGTSYKLRFTPQEKVNIPGGYGMYRVGSIGKLVELQKDPHIFQKTFTFASGMHISFMFYPKNLQNVYGDEVDTTSGIDTSPLNLILTGNSNASLFDKLYLFLFFSRESSQRFVFLDPSAYTNKNSFKEDIYDEHAYLEDTQGYFYFQKYRKENKAVRIVYADSYPTANALSSILESMGIRVVDISQDSAMDTKDPCIVKEGGVQFSQTALSIAALFGCRTEHTLSDGLSDILFVLQKTEKTWEVQ